MQVLDDHFAGQPNVFVGGNMFLYYEKGNRRKHISPDVMVTRGIPEEPPHDCYVAWAEEKAPDLVLEITSKSTRGEDKNKKFVLYRDVLRVLEYFLFDPRAEYLDPPLQGFRLIGREYLPIEPVAGRLPSRVLGLHLERDGVNLRFFDPTTGQRLLTPLEGRDAAARRAAQERERAEEERQRAEAAVAAQRNFAEANERLRHEIEAMRRG
jgi:hypothetical protein